MRPFDLAVSLNALHWVRDSVAALTHLSDAVNPDGGVVVQLVSEGERLSIEDVAYAVATDPTTPWAERFAGFRGPHVHLTAGEWRDVARAAGLVVDDPAERDLAWDFGTAEEFRAWCALGFTAYTDRLAPEQRDAFFTTVTDAYGRATGSDHVLGFLQLRMKMRRAA